MCKFFIQCFDFLGEFRGISLFLKGMKSCPFLLYLFKGSVLNQNKFSLKNLLIVSNTICISN